MAALAAGVATVWAAVAVLRLRADRTRHARVIAHAYDNADRWVCGLGGDELMRPLVGHPEHFPDVTDGYTLSGQVMG